MLRRPKHSKIEVVAPKEEEVILVYLMYYKNTCLSRLVENMKYLSQDGHSAG